MSELLQLAPQLGIAAFIIGAIVFLRREQQKNGGVQRAEFTAFSNRMSMRFGRVELKIDRLVEEQQEQAEKLAELRATIYSASRRKS